MNFENPENLPYSEPPEFIKPMLATLVDQPFNDENWIFEEKIDGYRAIAHKVKGQTKLYSRNKKSFNEDYPTILNAIEKLKHDVVLDGEIVVLDESNLPDFQKLQGYKKYGGNIKYLVFDLLYLNGVNIRELPLLNRKSLLKTVLENTSEKIVYVDHVENKGVELFNKLSELDEGIVAKRKESKYREGKRTKDWLKIKQTQRQEAVIAGYTKPRGGRKGIGALILGIYDNGKLKYIGHTGSGFDEKTLDILFSKLSNLQQKESPFEEDVEANNPPTWVKPELVCEIKFQEWTKEGSMRQPIFMGLREDKNPKQVHKEEAKNTEEVDFKSKPPNLKVDVSSPEKVLWQEEGYTKEDIVSYYEKISPYILPHLVDKPQVLHRFPNGVEEKGFYQKNIDFSLPDFVETVEIFSESQNKNINYMLCQNKETLLYMVNLGVVEMNPWLSRIGNLKKPDFFVMDLDPGERSFGEVVKTAQATKEVLDMACAKSYCKTSGKKGLHICVPLGGRYSYDQVKQFSRLIALAVNRKLPDLTSIERSPSNRGGRIYVDYLQNIYGQTIAAPYSARPVAGATISTPLNWSEVNQNLNLKKFTIKTVPKRVKRMGDIWKPLLKESTDIAESIQCLKEAL